MSAPTHILLTRSDGQSFILSVSEIDRVVATSEEDGVSPLKSRLLCSGAEGRYTGYAMESVEEIMAKITGGGNERHQDPEG